jgi:antitoxin component YwqK of YwqJK toxin-antitoxin module
MINLKALKREGDIMKKFCLVVGILLLFVFSTYSQNIKEIDGVYYEGDTLFTGSYSATFDNGKPRITMNIVDGLKEGEVKVYFENGELNEIRSYKRNVMNGTWLTYNDKKIRIAEAHYINGKKDGKWFIWDDNGWLIYELEYTAGEKTGIWKNYDKNGNIVSERSYMKIENQVVPIK